MGLQDTIKDHPVVCVAGAVAAGAGACWAAAQMLWIGPRDYTIQELRAKVTELEASQGKELTSAVATEPPSNLPFKVRPASAAHDRGNWFDGLTDKLAREGEKEPNTVLVRYEFDPFENAYRRFEMEILPIATVKLAGGYAFYVRPDKGGRFYQQIPIDYATRQVTVPQSRKGDGLVLMLRLDAPKTEQLDRLAGIKIK